VALAQQLRLTVERLRRTVRSQREIDFLAPRVESALSLLDREGPMTAAELARWQQVRPQSVRPTVSELVAASVVTREPDPADGRRAVLSITERGTSLLRRAAVHRDRDLAELLRIQLADAERDTVARALQILDRVADTDR
jgi:DNA-binding MarR family transcriptional regulator